MKNNLAILFKPNLCLKKGMIVIMKNLVKGMFLGAVIGGVIGSVASDEITDIKNVIMKKSKKLAKKYNWM